MTTYGLPYLEVLFWKLEILQWGIQVQKSSTKPPRISVSMSTSLVWPWVRRHPNLCAGGKGWRSETSIWEHWVSSSSSHFPFLSSHCWEDWRKRAASQKATWSNTWGVFWGGKLLAELFSTVFREAGLQVHLLKVRKITLRKQNLSILSWFCPLCFYCLQEKGENLSVSSGSPLSRKIKCGLAVMGQSNANSFDMRRTQCHHMHTQCHSVSKRQGPKSV